MKNLKLMSVMKHLGVAALGAVLTLGIVVLPKISVKAQTANQYDSSTKTLTLNEAIAAPDSISESGLALPSNCNNKNEVEHIIATSNCILNPDSSNLFLEFTNVKDIDLSKAKSTTESSSLTNLNSFFNKCEKLTTIKYPSDWNTSAVTDFSNMFCNCNSLTEIDLLGFNTSSAERFSSMFFGCYNIKTLNLYGFNVGNLEETDQMFELCYSLETIYAIGDNWANANIINSSRMFENCLVLVGGNGTKYDSTKTDRTYARNDTSSLPGYFSESYSIKLNGQLKTDGNAFYLDISFTNSVIQANDYDITWGTEVIDTDMTSDPGNVHFELKASAKKLNDSKELIIKVKGEDGLLFDKDIAITDYLIRITNLYPKTSKEYNIAGSILRYGAYAQKYFNYNTGNYANKNIDGYTFDDNFTIIPASPDVYPSYHPAYDYSSTDINELLEDTGATYAGMNLSLDEDITFMMAYKLPSEATGDNWSTWSKKTEFIDKVKSTSYIALSDESFSLDKNGKYAIVTIKSINVKKLNTPLFKYDYYGCDLSPEVYLIRSIYNNSNSELLINTSRSLYEFYSRVNQ